MSEEKLLGTMRPDDVRVLMEFTRKKIEANSDTRVFLLGALFLMYLDDHRKCEMIGEGIKVLIGCPDDGEKIVMSFLFGFPSSPVCIHIYGWKGDSDGAKDCLELPLFFWW